MKKFLATILSFIYVTTSVGATVHLHYCMNQLVEWGLGNKNSNAKICSFCGMARSNTDQHCEKENKGCCKDEQRFVKLENDQKISDASFKFSQISPNTITPGFSLDCCFEYIAALTKEFPVINGPPQTGNVSLFVRNCIFRI